MPDLKHHSHLQESCGPESMGSTRLPHTSQAAVNQNTRKKTFQTIAFLSILTMLTLIFRRPDQFLNPYIWVEDGTTILNQYMAHGWLTLFFPVNGYFILPTKIIHTFSVVLSFRWYPEISYGFTAAFTAFAISTIALAPTELKHKTWCAISVLLIPSGSEVFAVSEYALWWGGLLLFLPLLWKRNDQRLSLRLFITLLGGLSSPLVVFLSPIYLLRAILTRERVDKILTVAAIFAVSVQSMAIYFNTQTPQFDKLGFSIPLIIGKFFGWFVYWTPDPAKLPTVICAGVLCCLLLIFCAWPLLRRNNLALLLLCIALPLTIVSSIIRAPIEAIDPHITAPRYFFYPFILISWILIQSVDVKRSLRSCLAIVVFACSLTNFLLFSQWHHSSMNWRMQVNECLTRPEFMFQIHFQGRPDQQWGEQLTNAQCKKLVGSSLFDNKT